MIRISSSFAIFLLLSATAVSKASAPPPPATATPSAVTEPCVVSPSATQQRLPFDQGGLERRIAEVFGVEGSRPPGAAVIVVQDGRVIAQRQYGMASLEHRVPFTTNHVVRLPYSEGREFIAIAAMFM